MSKKTEQVDGGRLLKMVEAIAIAPADAEEVATNYRKQLEGKGLSHHEMQDAIAEKIVARYSKMAGAVGGASGLAGIIPGVGTAVAVTGGAIADAAASMKLQVDMSMCMAAAYDYDLNNEDARHISFLLAAGGALEKAGEQAAVQLASKAGVKMLKQYLRGAVLQAIKEMFKKLGIVFTRKALEKALPFGVGVIIGGTFNYALTRYVGNTAREWFAIDASMNA